MLVFYLTQALSLFLCMCVCVCLCVYFDLCGIHKRLINTKRSSLFCRNVSYKEKSFVTLTPGLS
jgi:hypothetical protein